MKNLAYLIIALLLSSACGQVYFTEPSPQRGVKLKSFPESIQGTYTDSTLQIVITSDSIRVFDEKYKLTKNDAGTGEVNVRFYQNMYFASFKDSLYYSVYMGSFYDNKLAVYMLNADERSINILSRFVEIDTLDVEKEHYLINPSKTEFDAIINNELFDVVEVLEKE